MSCPLEREAPEAIAEWSVVNKSRLLKLNFFFERAEKKSFYLTLPKMCNGVHSREISFLFLFEYYYKSGNADATK